NLLKRSRILSAEEPDLTGGDDFQPTASAAFITFRLSEFFLQRAAAVNCGKCRPALREFAEERTASDAGEREKARGELEAANEILHKEIEKLENALRQAESAKEELSQKTDECGKLKKEVVQLKDLKADLEEELQSTSAKNAQFAVQVSDLENQLKELVR
ncbi:hypothetical protein BaRGS_00030499, partial [Batillaria attramentaria]